MGKPPQHVVDLVEQRGHLPELVLALRNVAPDALECDRGGGEQLPGLVVDGVRDPLGVVLEALVEAA